MTTIRFCEPPEPPAGEPWCTVCLMVAKAQQQAADKAGLPALAQDGKRGDHWVPWDKSIRLNPGRYRGVSDLHQLGVIDVCWDHIAGLAAQRVSPLAVPNGATAPGLVRGQG